MNTRGEFNRDTKERKREVYRRHCKWLLRFKSRGLLPIKVLSRSDEPSRSPRVHRREDLDTTTLYQCNLTSILSPFGVNNFTGFKPRQNVRVFLTSRLLNRYYIHTHTSVQKHFTFNNDPTLHGNPLFYLTRQLFPIPHKQLFTNLFFCTIHACHLMISRTFCFL